MAKEDFVAETVMAVEVLEADSRAEAPLGRDSGGKEEAYSFCQ